MPRRHFDMIAKHSIVTDLERGDPRLFAIFGLEQSDGAPALSARLPQFIQRRVVALRNIAALGTVDRGRWHERTGKKVDQLAMSGEMRKQLSQKRRQIGQGLQPVMQPSRLTQAIAQLAKIPRATPAR